MYIRDFSDFYSYGAVRQDRYLMDIFHWLPGSTNQDVALSFKSRSKDTVAIVTMDLSQNMYGINIHYRRH